MSYEARLAELNIWLPDAPAAAGMYSPVVQVGNLLYLAGHIPSVRGKVGVDVTEQEAAAAAYWQTYPDGHERAGHAWKQALRAVRDAGVAVSEDTLKRAVAPPK